MSGSGKEGIGQIIPKESQESMSTTDAAFEARKLAATWYIDTTKWLVGISGAMLVAAVGLLGEQSVTTDYKLLFAFGASLLIISIGSAAFMFFKFADHWRESKGGDGSTNSGKLANLLFLVSWISMIVGVISISCFYFAVYLLNVSSLPSNPWLRATYYTDSVAIITDPLSKTIYRVDRNSHGKLILVKIDR